MHSKGQIFNFSFRKLKSSCLSNLVTLANMLLVCFPFQKKILLLFLCNQRLIKKRFKERQVSEHRLSPVFSHAPVLHLINLTLSYNLRYQAPAFQSKMDF